MSRYEWRQKIIRDKKKRGMKGSFKHAIKRDEHIMSADFQRQHQKFLEKEFNDEWAEEERIRSNVKLRRINIEKVEIIWRRNPA
jgi:hypothetical protein